MKSGAPGWLNCQGQRHTFRQEGAAENDEGEGQRLEVLRRPEADDSVVDGETGAHAEDPDAGDEWRDVLHVTVAVRMLFGGLLGRLLDPVGQNDLEGRGRFELYRNPNCESVPRENCLSKKGPQKPLATGLGHRERTQWC